MNKLPGLTAATPRTEVLLLFFALLFSFRAFSSDRGHMLPLTLEERVNKADMVVEGEVVSQKSFWDTGQKNIYTSNLIRVYKSFKGKVESQLVELITEGGSIGLKKHVVSTALQLRPGQQGVFFLKRQQQLPRSPGSQYTSTMAYGSQQGYVKYDLAGKRAIGSFDSYSSIQGLYQDISRRTGQNYSSISRNEALEDRPAVEQKQQQVQDAKLAPLITSFLPTTVSAGTGVVLTINGSGFGATRGNGAVEFRNADDGGQTFVQPLASSYIFWSDNQIRLYVPSATEDRDTPGSGPIRVVTNDGSVISSTIPIIIEFAYSNVVFDDKTFRPRLIDVDGLGGYTIRYAPSMLGKQRAQEGFRRAMTTWVCVSGVNWKIGEPTTIEEAEEDETTVVRFASNSTVGAGVLARTFSYYEGCIVGGRRDTVWYVTEFDMEINSSISWEYGPGPPQGKQFDFETVMLHELGHAHQLSHVILPSAIMHYAVENERIIRDLSAADVVGANLIMANSVGENACEAPMKPSTAAECNLAPEIYTFSASYTSPNTVAVNWTTQNEVQVDFFVVQRSTNATDWEDIGTVDAEGVAGNRAEIDYTFMDNNPLPAIGYYRLRVVYSDRRESFSPRVRVINPDSVRQLSVYPSLINEETNIITLLYIVENTTILNAKLYDMAGRLVRDFELTFRDINLPVEVDVAGLAAGIYILKWQERNMSGQVKILKR
ncbi:IPT/TIG domain-containing protein [Pontibacter toksunensis]|uniref:IPT/TIG domain-containing protein n=1 Tax=Pontibacter toksunensis TaxID=1332631 RepID=A0ABW6BSR8_9BACT